MRALAKQQANSVDASDGMRWLVKEELLRLDGTPLYPERIACTVNYDLSPWETVLYQAVTEYVQEEFNRADAAAVTVTANEILTALNAEESNSGYIPALVMADGKKTTTYLQHPFHKQPEWAANSVNCEIVRLRQEGVVLLETFLNLEN